MFRACHLVSWDVCPHGGNRRHRQGHDRTHHLHTCPRAPPSISDSCLPGFRGRAGLPALPGAAPQTGKASGMMFSSAAVLPLLWAPPGQGQTCRTQILAPSLCCLPPERASGFTPVASVDTSVCFSGPAGTQHDKEARRHPGLASDAALGGALGQSRRQV